MEKNDINLSVDINQSRVTHTISLDSTGWLAISFTAGCFGFGWVPFVVVVILTILLKD